MRKVIKGITASILLLPVLASSPQWGHAATAEKIVPTTHPIIVTYNARQMDLLGAKADLKGGSVYVPLRGVAQAMGASVQYSDGNVTLSKDANSVELKAGSKVATINGNNINFAQPMYSQNGRTMVPLRLIAEAFEEKVEWDGALDYVWIGNKEVPDIESVTKPVSLEPYKDYYEGAMERLLISWGSLGKLKQTKGLILSRKNFPISIKGVSYFRIDLVSSNKSNQFLRFTSSSKTPAIGLAYLIKDDIARLRGDIVPFRERTAASKANYYPIASIADRNDGIATWESLTLSEIKYIQLRIDYDYTILFKAN
ncbi:Copper amine oxidase N-terminal domain-containing protein [Paenibacillaceae bacterium GAS479]|nr:Copper amine oxidase N-terminal domain-containing protein [Paenibacillaceae bacterium GAS479]